LQRSILSLIRNNPKWIKLENSVVELTGKLERLVGNGLNLVVDSATDWKSALVQNDGDYAKARRQYPELYQRFMDANKK